LDRRCAALKSDCDGRSDGDAPLPKSSAKLDIMNCAFRGVQRGIDVPNRAILETPRGWIVLFTRCVGAYLSQQFGGSVQATAIVIRYIGTGMVVDILAIIDGGTPDFCNGAINFADRLTFMCAHGSITRPMFEHPPRSTQIRQRMQVGWVLGGLRGTPRAKQHQQP
jgi:hypothetical protein